MSKKSLPQRPIAYKAHLFLNSKLDFNAARVGLCPHKAGINEADLDEKRKGGREELGEAEGKKKTRRGAIRDYTLFRPLRRLRHRVSSSRDSSSATIHAAGGLR